MNNQAFYKFVEGRANSGYKSAIVVKEADQTKYSLLIASTTVPSIYGTPNSFEFDLLNATSIGKVQGKDTLEDKDVEFLLHRDNIYRLEQFRGKVCDFMYVTPDLMGWKFTGTIKFRPNDAGAETLMGTYTVSPMSASEKPILNVRGMLMETVLFAEAIPDHLDGLTTTGTTISCSTDPTGATISCTIYDVDANGVQSEIASTNFEASVASTGSQAVTIKQATGATTGTHYGIAYIKATKTGYASWTTTVAVSTTKV